jgi:phosphoglycerate dehydrogenase-like enzyme
VLTTALKEGWITGAALDVFETEPLPSESELWDLPNVILTPHTAGHSENHSTFLTEFFCENLRRYITGNQMMSVVDKTKGY